MLDPKGLVLFSNLYREGRLPERTFRSLLAEIDLGLLA